MRRYTKISGTTGDAYLDMLASALARAFNDAEQGCETSKDDLISFFGLNRLRYLYQHGLIKWNPGGGD